MKPVKLTLAELASRELGQVRALIEQRLAKHRADLERDQDEKTTTLLRGRIRESKELLAELNASPAQAPTPFDDAVGMVGISPFYQPEP